MLQNWDKNNDGSIDAEEYKKAMAEAGHSLNDDVSDLPVQPDGNDSAAIEMCEVTVLCLPGCESGLPGVRQKQERRLRIS